MKFNLNKFFILIASLLVFSVSVYAQRGVEIQYASPLDPSKKPTPIYFGPAFGFNIMGHSMNIPTFEEDLTCPNFKNASGLGIYAGMTLEHLFGDVATSSSSLIFRLLYNMYPGSVAVEDKVYSQYVTSADGYVPSNLEHTMDIDYNAFTFEVMYKINPVPAIGLGIVVGPALDYIIKKDRTQKSKIVTPNNAQFNVDNFGEGTIFEDNYRTVLRYDGEIEESSSIRFGVKAGIQYEILLGSKLYIAPVVAYNFGITSLSSIHTWRVSPLQVGIDLRFAF
ncbi:MAG: hypothetical protein FWG85_02865 [Bacteroidetes bacterium]|nr:hypothetical protein [Bacteroidota bacterium]